MKKGYNCEISHDAYFAEGLDIEIGDNVYIGPKVRIVGNGRVKIGDYTKIHEDCLILALKYVEIGHNCWFGERCVIDGSGGIKIGNNVGVGVASQLYSHVAHGDVLEGCQIFGHKELTIDDDAWLVGMCLVSPVHIGKKSVAYLGSVVTKDMNENSVYAGVPAIDITKKVGQPWQTRNPKEKLMMFHELLNDFKLSDPSFNSTCIIPVIEWPNELVESISYFNVVTREYTKRLSANEIKFMKWLTSWKGRFIPLNV